MSILSTIFEPLGGWLGVSPHLDDKLGVPAAWRVIRAIAVIVAGFVAAMWPDVKEALFRACIALLSIGGVAWLINLCFWLAWRKTYDTVSRVQALLREAADLIGKSHVPIGDSHAIAERSWNWHKAQEFMLHALTHAAVADFDQYLKIEEKKHNDADTWADPFQAWEVTAVYLRSLARRLKASDLRTGFVLPASFAQYATSDTWPGVKKS